MLTALRDQLKSNLSGAAPGATTEPRPNVADVAEQIKALKSTNTIDTAPERIGKRRGSAEEPVTARIRRRMEAILVSDPSIEPDSAAKRDPDGPSVQ